MLLWFTIWIFPPTSDSKGIFSSLLCSCVLLIIFFSPCLRQSTPKVANELVLLHLSGAIRDLWLSSGHMSVTLKWLGSLR